VVVGTGSELPAWKERTRLLGIADRVSFLGFRRDVPQILGASDALLAPARYEAYGAGVHEALCCGLPALVSSTAGVAERYPASLTSLLLDEPESPRAVAAALRVWRSTASDCQARARTLSDFLRARDWDAMARDIVSLCELRA
jgi:glycosyltransferase involved in cell wall biosynthesis